MKTRRVYSFVLAGCAILFIIIWLKTSSPNDTVTAPEGNGSLSKGDELSERSASPVKVSVYYETLCPDSMAFIEKQLYPTYQKVGAIMKVDLIPYGKASYKSSGDTWTFQCQHGQRECEGNTIHSCTLNAYPDVSQSLPFVECTMSQDPIGSTKQCASKFGLEYKKINECATSNRGSQLLHDMGVRTESLDPRLHFVPWIVINDVFVESQMQRALDNLLGVVCGAYKGPLPSQCPA